MKRVHEADLKSCLAETAQRCATDDTRERKPLPWMVVIGADELATVQDMWAAIQKDQPEKVAGVDMDIAPDQRSNGSRFVVWFAREEWIPPRPPLGKGGSDEGPEGQGEEGTEGKG